MRKRKKSGRRLVTADGGERGQRTPYEALRMEWPHSRLSFMYHKSIGDCQAAMTAGLPSLEHVGFDTSLRESVEYPVDIPLEDDWERTMLMAGPQVGPTITYKGRAVQEGRLLWMLMYDWPRSLAPHQAFLDSQAEVEPRLMSLTPGLTVPAMFLSCAGEREDIIALARSGVRLMGAAAMALNGLVQSLFSLWLHGDSERAVKYRERTGMAEGAPAPVDGRALVVMEDLVGPDALEDLFESRRFELELVVLLEETGAWLWGDAPEDIPSSPVLQGLLAIHLWTCSQAEAFELAPVPPETLNEVERLWREGPSEPETPVQ